MTSRGQVLALRWLVAPVVAGSFALVADWTVQHDPAQPADHPAAVDRGRAKVDPLQHSARIAARRLARAQTSLLRLESSLQRRSARANRLAAVLRTAQHSGRVGPNVPALRTGTLTGPPASAPLPPVAVPNQQLHTTTGAS
jgi:hypothetical protein